MILDAEVPSGEITLDAVRIGYEAENAQTTTWIGMKRGTITPDSAGEIVNTIKEACLQLGAINLEVEIRTVKVYRCSHSKCLDPIGLGLDMSKLVDPFCWSISTSISSSTQPQTLGTAGLWMTLPDKDNLFMLTAQHVVEANPNATLDPSVSGCRAEIRISTQAVAQTSIKNREWDVAQSADRLERAHSNRLDTTSPHLDLEVAED
jgi:hypothetical protein